MAQSAGRKYGEHTSEVCNTIHKLEISPSKGQGSSHVSSKNVGTKPGKGVTAKKPSF
jgi:hypothetical protein